MGFLDFFRPKQDRSSDIARQRLLTVLVHDRVKLTPAMMEQLKAELSAVIAKYVSGADAEAIEVSLLHGESFDHLKAEIPIRRTGDSESM